MRTIAVGAKWEDLKGLAEDMQNASEANASNMYYLFEEADALPLVNDFRSMVSGWLDDPTLSHIEMAIPDRTSDEVEIRGIFIRKYDEGHSYHLATAESIQTASNMLGPLLASLRDRDTTTDMARKVSFIKTHGDENHGSYANEFTFTFGEDDHANLHGNIRVKVIHVMEGVLPPGAGVDEGRSAPTNVFHVRLPAEERKQ